PRPPLTRDPRPKPAGRPAHRCHLGVLANRSGEAPRVVLEVLDHFGARRERVRLAARVVEAGETLGPVRRVEDEAVPSLRAPPLGNPATLEHEMRTVGTRE